MNTLTIFSAGVPLTYNHPYGSSSMSEKNLTTNFLKIPIALVEKGTYRKNGFIALASLDNIFTNKYTSMKKEEPEVRSMKSEDIYFLTGLTEMKQGKDMNLNNIKYNKLLVNGAYYFLASTCNDNYLWYVHDDGNVNSSGNYYEHRNSPSSIFTSYC